MTTIITSSEIQNILQPPDFSPNSNGKVPAHCPMIQEISTLAKPGITGSIKWGHEFSMTVKYAKNCRKECKVVAHSTHYSFDCLHPTKDTLRFIRKLTGYSTVDEEAEDEAKLIQFFEAINPDEDGQRHLFGRMVQGCNDPGTSAHLLGKRQAESTGITLL